MNTNLVLTLFILLLIMWIIFFATVPIRGRCTNLDLVPLKAQASEEAERTCSQRLFGNLPFLSQYCVKQERERRLNAMALERCGR